LKTGEEIALPRSGQGIWIGGSDGRDETQLSPWAWHIVFSPLDEEIVAYVVRESADPNIERPMNWCFPVIERLGYTAG